MTINSSNLSDRLYNLRQMITPKATLPQLLHNTHSGFYKQNQLLKPKSACQTHQKKALVQHNSNLHSELDVIKQCPDSVGEGKSIKKEFAVSLYLNKMIDLQTSSNQRHKEKFVAKIDSLLVQNTFKAIRHDFGPNIARSLRDYLNILNIKCLCLDKNPLRDQGVTTLAGCLPDSKLQELSLVSISMQNKGCNALIEALTGLSSLKRLNISSEQGLTRNRADQQGMRNMHKLFGHQNCSIEYLNISNLGLGEKGFTEICKALSKSKTLIQFSCCSNDVTAKMIRYFFECTAELCLFAIDFSKNIIGDQGIKILGQFLGIEYGKNNLSQSLHKLNLSDNRIKSLGIEHFSRDMAANQALGQLLLDRNMLSFGERFFNFKYYIIRNWFLHRLSLRSSLASLEDIRLLCQGIELNRSISFLDLSKTHFSVDAFISICKLIGNSKTLIQITLDNCNITDNHLLKCQSEFVGLGTTQQINISNNFISDKGGNILLEILCRSPRIVVISLTKNCLSLPMQGKISDLLNQHKGKNQPVLVSNSSQEQLEEVYKQQYDSLLTSVEQLKSKLRKMTENKILSEIVSKQIEENSILKQIEQEKMIISRLECQITLVMKNTSKYRDMLPNVDQNNQNNNQRILITESVQ